MRFTLTALLAAALAAPCVRAQGEVTEEAPATTSAPTIAEALAGASEEVKTFNDHIVTLSSPWMEGRLPGTRGMEIAKDYMQWHLEQTGLEPGFPKIESDSTGVDVVRPHESFRQEFKLGGRRTIKTQTFMSGDMELDANKDYVATGMGPAGQVGGELVFVGYGIEKGRDGYTSFEDDTDLTGKVALMLRFEPMNEDGKSAWVTGRRPWSAAAGFQRKLAAVAKRNPAAIVIANPPGCADPRSDTIKSIRGSRMCKVPVFAMSREGVTKLAKAHGADVAELKSKADAGTHVMDLGGKVALTCEIETKTQKAENVAGFLRGKGDLADELIIVGAHLDHLGDGQFGSRRGAGKLHPGADDNASGAAAVLMLAERAKKAYDAMPEGANARSVLFVGFSAEESGLNGSRHYVENPIVPIEKHALMINFDMIGRIENGNLNVTGTDTAKGFGDVLRPLYEKSGLNVKANTRISGGSDHLPFYGKQIPILFGICDLHNDYHTPDDVSWKINRIAGVKTVDLFEKIVDKASTWPEKFEFQPLQGRRRGRQ